MKPIKSFCVDHTKLEKGIYVSRKDKVGVFGYATTFDLRMKTPYKDAPLSPATVHTLEHCLATYLRNARRDILYVGGMGCLTGFYVIVSGRKKVEDILPTIEDALAWTETINEIPGASKKECGNYTFMNLPDAKKEAKDYLDVLRFVENK